MDILVDYIDQRGNHSNKTIPISRLAFAKHLAIAGQGYAPAPQKLWRTFGMFFHYSNYIRRNEFYTNNRFSEPPIALSDPTEKGQFSNLAGKAIADFLSKRIDQSLFTVNYEAAMRLQRYKLRGARPDLIAYSPNKVFALEAKGRHQPNPGSMVNHKRQANSGPLAVNFSVACVSYNLFDRVIVNYHDPVNQEIPFDNLSLGALSRNYYRYLSEFLNEKVFESSLIEYQGEKFYEITFSRDYLRNNNFFDRNVREWLLFEVFDFLRPRLILPERIRDYAEDGINNNTIPFIMEGSQSVNSNVYIDNDRVGLRING